MGVLDSIKNIFTIPAEDEEFDDEMEEQSSHRDDYYDDYEPAPKKQEAPRIIKRSSFGKAAAVQPSGQMQVVLKKPDRFDDVTEIADHLNAGKTVVLNLEDTNREISRRIVDFISGVAYANGDSMKKVARNTFIIAANGIDVSGELMLDDYDESRLY